MSDSPTELSDREYERYEWQMWSPEIGREGQRKLKSASVLVSRIGGVGGTAAMYLAAAGVGRLIVAHGGNLRVSDLNRQILMQTDGIGTSRVDLAIRRLREINPEVDYVPVPENISPDNADRIVGLADLVIDAAPLFSERFAMNHAAVLQRKPVIEAAMFDFEGQLTTIVPGRTACLRCLYPVDPPHWKRQFPVFGAVAGTMGALAAVEAIKRLTNTGETIEGRLLTLNLRNMKFRSLPLLRNPDCRECGHVPSM